MKFQNMLTNMFTERENKKEIFAPCIGEVVEAPPNLIISIWGGDVILNNRKLYMNDRLFDDYTREFKLNGKIGKIKIDATTATGESGPGPHTHAHKTIEGSGEYESTGIIVNTCTLAKGDLVKVTPVEDGQKWIVDFKIRKLVK